MLCKISVIWLPFKRRMSEKMLNKEWVLSTVIFTSMIRFIASPSGGGGGGFKRGSPSYSRGSNVGLSDCLFGQRVYELNTVNYLVGSAWYRNYSPVQAGRISELPLFLVLAPSNTHSASLLRKSLDVVWLLRLGNYQQVHCTQSHFLLNVM